MRTISTYRKSGRLFILRENDFECFAKTGVKTLEMAKVSGKLRQARRSCGCLPSTFRARAVRTWAPCPKSPFGTTAESGS